MIDIDVSKFLKMNTEPFDYASMTDAFIGTKQIRYGPRPSSENLREIDKVMSECLEKQRPIEILIFWSGTKGYNAFSINTADFLDVMGLTRISTLQESIRKFHSPGISLTIIWEDFTERVTASAGYLPAYHHSFVPLIGALNMNDYVQIVMESSLLNEEKALKRVQENAIALLNDKPETVGWVGEIPWDHYVPRARSEFPNHSLDQLKESISVYFGIVLARYQMKMVPKHDLKLSFCPYPQTVPNSMRRRRAEYKIKPNKNGDKTAAPWTSFGLIRQSKGDWTHISAKEARTLNYSQQTFTINGYEFPCLIME